MLHGCAKAKLLVDLWLLLCAMYTCTRALQLNYHRKQTNSGHQDTRRGGRAALNYYHATALIGPKRHQGHRRTHGGTKRDTRGRTGDRDTSRTGGHSGGIGRDTKRTGGNKRGDQSRPGGSSNCAPTITVCYNVAHSTVQCGIPCIRVGPFPLDLGLLKLKTLNKKHF
jgi:hypothetical protein